MGSLAAAALNSWYHTRMLERKRLAKQYQVVPGGEEEDLELGEGVGALESGTVVVPARTLDQEVDNWDENVEDNWEDDEHVTTDSLGEAANTPSASSVGDDGDVKKRAD